MTLIVDASVVMKWVLPEVDSQAARSLIGSEPLAAPDFMRLECAHVLARESRRGRLSAADAIEGLRTIDACNVRLESLATLVDEAHVIGLALRASVYDSLYLALAIRENARLITADRRFADAALAVPSYAGSIRLL